MAEESPYIVDGSAEFSLGQDAWHDPGLIQDNQYAAGVNLTVRGGVLRPRCGFVQQELTLPTDSLTFTQITRSRSAATIWKTGKFQAMIPYTIGSDNYLVVVISGYLFLVNVVTSEVRLLSTDITVGQYYRRINWSYAGPEHVVIFDYPDYPVIVSPTGVERADPAKYQVPKSVLGAYNGNRLFIADDGVSLTASDAVGNLATPDAPLTFKEVLLPNTGYTGEFFSLPDGNVQDSISAMGFIQSVDTSTGVGQMFAATKNKLFTYQTAQPRSAWKNSVFGTVLLNDAGIAGPRAFVNVNSDVIFLSGAGQVHAFSTARNDARRWGNIPISREVVNYLKYSSTDYADLAFLGYFGNRVFIATNPFRVSAQDAVGQPVPDYATAGMVVLETDSAGSLLVQGTPVWNGLWTGVNAMDMAVVGGRCFIMSKDGDRLAGVNTLYEVDQSITYDVVGGKRRPVRSVLYTKEYAFKSPLDDKQEDTVKLLLNDLAGSVAVDVYRKPTHGTYFAEYRKWRYCAPDGSESVPNGPLVNGFAKHQLKKIVFGDAITDPCNPVTRDTYSVFLEMQYKLVITGMHWVLKQLAASARLLVTKDRQLQEGCVDYPKVAIPEPCNSDWTIPAE